jgi:hypothetical protein
MGQILHALTSRLPQHWAGTNVQAKANLRQQVDLLRRNRDVRASLFFNAFGTNPSPVLQFGASELKGHPRRIFMALTVTACYLV